MIGACRKYRIVPVFVLAALVWGFAVPIVHLACAMSAVEVDVLCEDVAAHGHGADVHGPAMHSDVFVQSTATDAAPDQPALECCQIDDSASDHRAPLPVITQVQNAAAETLDIPVEAPDTSVVFIPDDADRSPPIALRLLFSVFLI